MAVLEASVDPDSVYVSTDELERRITDRANWVCVVDTGRGARGTGLLISPAHVLTNFHVIEPLLDAGDATGARCRFDFRTDEDTEEINEGRWIDFAEVWCEAKSPYGSLDRKGARAGFAADELDYAIIRLAEPIGDQPVVGGEAAWPRGWLPIPDRADHPANGATIYVYQHPLKHRDGVGQGGSVMPQKCTDGSVIEYLDTDLRMRHSATTFNGSSGAPCFDAKFRLVALHHAGDKTSDIADFGAWNQAIPIGAIVRHLRACGNERLIGILPPSRRRTARRIDIAARVATLSEDDIDRRLMAAAVLMDRDGAEEKVAWARRSRDGNRGIAHVLTCRYVDRHDYFFKRLSVLTLDDPDAKRKRQLAFLGEGCNDYPWQREPVVWHADEPEEFAMDLVRDRLSAISRMPGRIMAVATVAIDQARIVIARERRMVRAVAEHCAAISDADRLQFFVVYHDAGAKPGADRTLERRKELARLWDLRDRPPGCGVCIALDDVDTLELNAWCDALQTAWKLSDGKVAPVVEQAFAGQARLPLLDVETSIKPGLRQLISAQT